MGRPVRLRRRPVTGGRLRREAILCGNDDTAMAVRRALYDVGRDVPGDVSLAGIDDVPGSAYWTPALTTIRMDFAGLGRACVAGVAAALDGRPRPEVTPAAPSLVIRESTAPPPAGRPGTSS